MQSRDITSSLGSPLHQYAQIERKRTASFYNTSRYPTSPTSLDYLAGLTLVQVCKILTHRHQRFLGLLITDFK
jgi:hypothetical protein